MLPDAHAYAPSIVSLLKFGTMSEDNRCIAQSATIITDFFFIIFKLFSSLNDEITEQLEPNIRDSSPKLEKQMYLKKLVKQDVFFTTRGIQR